MIIYKLNGIPITTYGAFPALSGDVIAISGMFDCPRRKSPTERSWDTAIEPFVEAEDIKWEGRDLSISFGIMKSDPVDQFKTALVNCTTLSVNTFDFNVICRSEVSVKELGDCFKISVKYWQEEVSIPVLSATASNSGAIRIDGYNLQKDLGIHGSSGDGFYSIAQRLEVNTTELYQNTQYRDFRDIQISCFMIGSSLSDLVSKMNQFQALLYKEGMRTLTVEDRSYSCYHKAGFQAQMVAENLLKFTLKLSTND